MNVTHPYSLIRFVFRFLASHQPYIYANTLFVCSSPCLTARAVLCPSIQSISLSSREFVYNFGYWFGNVNEKWLKVQRTLHFIIIIICYYNRSVSTTIATHFASYPETCKAIAVKHGGFCEYFRFPSDGRTYLQLVETVRASNDPIVGIALLTAIV